MEVINGFILVEPRGAEKAAASIVPHMARKDYQTMYGIAKSAFGGISEDDKVWFKPEEIHMISSTEGFVHVSEIFMVEKT